MPWWMAFGLRSHLVQTRDGGRTDQILVGAGGLGGKSVKLPYSMAVARRAAQPIRTTAVEDEPTWLVPHASNLVHRVESNSSTFHGGNALETGASEAIAWDRTIEHIMLKLHLSFETCSSLHSC